MHLLELCGKENRDLLQKDTPGSSQFDSGEHQGVKETVKLTDNRGKGNTPKDKVPPHIYLGGEEY